MNLILGIFFFGGLVLFVLGLGLTMLGSFLSRVGVAMQKERK